MSSVKTNKYREKRAKADAGAGTLPAVTKICLGIGGVDSNGKVKSLTGAETSLFNQVIEKNATVSFPSPYTARFTISVDADLDNLVGKDINEAALRDAQGDLAAIKTFSNKGLDSGNVFEFDYDMEE